MARTLMTLDDQAKAWLAKRARAERVSRSEIVRRAVGQFRAEYERTQALTQGLQQTAGIWKHGDGLDWQKRLRDEWKGRLITSRPDRLMDNVSEKITCSVRGAPACYAAYVYIVIQEASHGHGSPDPARP